ncbi:MAG: IS200/IS605 family transposase [Candidatus Eremiobacteraeota bacterium]|nr:IS200/IS605 family transposase [Candidatus Eremiobacteraeota bacterium]
MSKHSYVRIFIHLIWGTQGHERIITGKVGKSLFEHIISYAKKNGIPVEKMNIQPEHIHCLISLPPDKNISQVAGALKGESSRWINENDFFSGKFRWQRGYGAFSVSSSQYEVVKSYISRQNERHKRKSFLEEYKEWAMKYGVWEDR